MTYPEIRARGRALHHHALIQWFHNGTGNGGRGGGDLNIFIIFFVCIKFYHEGNVKIAAFN